jgi:hypothetical protein
MLLLVMGLVVANPATIDRVLASARPGDQIRLARGDYGSVTICGRHWPKPISIDASAATLRFVIRKSSGVSIRGGTFGPALDGTGYAAQVQQSSNVSFDGSSFRNSVRGLVIDRSQAIRVNRAHFIDLVTDGVDIALSRQVSVTNSRCERFKPRPKDHPDCIQGWSRPGGITSDIEVSRNVIVGAMQGIFFGNHVRGGVDDGGFDRVRITDNVVHVAYGQGIGLYDCRDCLVTGNKVSTAPGARWRASINIRAGRVRAANNSVGAKPAAPAGGAAAR